MEVATIVIGYLGYALVRLAVKASHTSAFAHAAQLWRAERAMHLNIEPSLNHLAAAHPALAEAAGYYYGLLNFIITPLVLAWLYLRRPPRSGRCGPRWCCPPPRPTWCSGPGRPPRPGSPCPA